MGRREWMHMIPQSALPKLVSCGAALAAMLFNDCRMGLTYAIPNQTLTCRVVIALAWWFGILSNASPNGAIRSTKSESLGVECDSSPQRPLPAGGHLEQADGTACSAALFCQNIIKMSAELTSCDPTYGGAAASLWNVSRGSLGDKPLGTGWHLE